MIGLPTETDEDLVAIRDLTLADPRAHARRTRGRAARVGRIVASVNPLVPKPGTTYQWMPMTDARRHRARRSSGCAHSSATLDNVYFNIKSERHSYYQGLLSLGDRRVADVIELRRSERRQLARGRRRGRPRRRRVPLPRPQRRRLPAVADHRRRHEDRLLPPGAREERRAPNGRCPPKRQKAEVSGSRSQVLTSRSRQPDL